MPCPASQNPKAQQNASPKGSLIFGLLLCGRGWEQENKKTLIYLLKFDPTVILFW